jgi:hypothetical protein
MAAGRCVIHKYINISIHIQHQHRTPFTIASVHFHLTPQGWSTLDKDVYMKNVVLA